MNKTWKPWPHGECHHCGASVEVLTDCEPGYVGEDDDVRCTECGCLGVVGIDDDEPYVTWHDYPDCTCEWCRAHYDDNGEWIGE